ncbi:Aldo/keto reductase [Ceraceosorus guamensis]|uniref:Aldo/keto reductase n=1 Tax=Ceraceosorus guamensis TaxID=1522189 RepID=A0A316VW94_9BASI|nr:Aldo/keto reductase [Ceraceosorus guamensis]PWN39725.1 Aldo/keto reductase [Ceraceosorus guamensis]
MSLPTVKLVSGRSVPRLSFGIGTQHYQSDASSQVSKALSAGFTFLDAAEVYSNTKSMGKAVSEHLSSGVASRKDLFLLTKLGSRGIPDPLDETKKELSDIGVSDKLDAVLLHYPPRGKNGAPSNIEAWNRLEKVKDAGLVDVIGVSNWTAKDIEELLASKPKHKIEINQVELNPFLYSHPDIQALLKLQEREGIATMSYGSLTSQYKDLKPDSKFQQTLESVASKHGVSPGTALLYWNLQRTNGIVVTTSGKEERMKQYVEDIKNIKTLSEEELRSIEDAAAAEGAKGKKYYMNPFWEP